jgi:complex iron-sulfur molybdoenzyme family reductase subunit gamma
MRVEQFSDSVALEFPATAAVTVPSICMGQADAGVNIWQWRADSQSGSREPADQFPNQWVEQYPSDDPEFVTARAAGNPYAIADGGAVQDLVATAFGTIGPASSQAVQGQGVYDGGSWSVVFARTMEEANPSLVSFHETGSTDMAFAVWDGSNGDRNGQKSVSTFVTLSLVPGKDGTNVTALALAAGVFAVLAAAGILVAVYGYKRAD